MALDNSDKRRIFLATTLTLFALPALWWANQSDNSSAPNVAAVGVEVGADGEDSNPAPPDGPNLPAVEPLGDTDPIFFGGPAGIGAVGAAEVAVPAASPGLISTTATYRSSIPGVGSCVVPGMKIGKELTVVNLNNNRSVTCVTVRSNDTDTEHLVLHTNQFSQLASLTDAPIPVEINT